MNRRDTIGALLALGAVPRAAEAQTGRMARVGVIRTTGATDFPQFAEAFRSGLRGAGYIEGRNVSVEYRWAEGDAQRLPLLADDLVRLDVDVIVASGTDAALAVRRASSTIPLVFLAAGDPVGSGLVATLARPGGNSTGPAFLTPEVNDKRLGPPEAGDSRLRARRRAGQFRQRRTPTTTRSARAGGFRSATEARARRGPAVRGL